MIQIAWHRLSTDTKYRETTGPNGTLVDNLKDSITVKDGLNATIGDLSFNYGYDGNKNVTSETTGSNGTLAGYSYSATYDDQDRLKTWTRQGGAGIPARSQSWTLDLVGNWDGFTNNGTAQVRTYSDAHETDTIDGNSLSHDAKGNLLTDHRSPTTSLIWDIDNHLQSASIVGVSPASTYEYDALGRRVAKTVNGVSTVFFSLAQAPSYGFTPGQVIAEYAGGVAAGTPLRTFVYGSYIDEALAKIESGNTLYYHCNRKFDVAGLTDAAGTIVELYAYSPYGTQTAMDASGTDIGISAQNNPYGFTGRRLDEETGLWYFRARYFDSELGRFISRDPLGFVDGLSLYAGYFAMHWGADPSGRRWIKKSETVYEAGADGDTLKQLSQMVTEGDPSNWVCIWIMPCKPGASDKVLDKWLSKKGWGNYPVAKKGAKADVSNLIAKTGKKKTHVLGGLSLFTRDMQRITRGLVMHSGEAVARDIKRLSGQGSSPILEYNLVGHHSGGELGGDLWDESPTGTQISFNVNHIFGVAKETSNGNNSKYSAAQRIGPPKCWFTRNSNIWGLGCNTNGSFMRKWASSVARKGGIVHGTNNSMWSSGRGVRIGPEEVEPGTRTARTLSEVHGLDGWSSARGTQ